MESIKFINFSAIFHFRCGNNAQPSRRWKRIKFFIFTLEMDCREASCERGEILRGKAVMKSFMALLGPERARARRRRRRGGRSGRHKDGANTAQAKRAKRKSEQIVTPSVNVWESVYVQNNSSEWNEADSFAQRNCISSACSPQCRSTSRSFPFSFHFRLPLPPRLLIRNRKRELEERSFNSWLRRCRLRHALRHSTHGAHWILLLSLGLRPLLPRPIRTQVKGILCSARLQGKLQRRYHLQVHWLVARAQRKCGSCIRRYRVGVSLVPSI